MTGGQPISGWSAQEIRAAARWAFAHAKNLVTLVDADDLSLVREPAVQAARRCAQAADRAAGGLVQYDRSLDRVG